MYLKHLSLTNFRTFTRLDLKIPQREIVLVGKNAQGKTSVLEAIYFLAAFTSFQTNTDRQMVNFYEAKKNTLGISRLVAEYKRGKSDHRIEVRLILEPMGVNGQRLRKEILLDGVKKQAGDVIGHFNAVIFVPQMSAIMDGSPDERRRYINLAISQSNPAYARALSDYQQALTQRNALLKALSENGGDRNQLSVWDEAIARLGAQIILWRIEAIQQIEKLASRVHHDLTHESETLRLAYEPAYDPLPKPSGQLGLRLDTPIDRTGLDVKEIQKGFSEKLIELRSEEIARGVTTIGPHRDELRFLANGVDLGEYGSRGQIKTTLLSLKLAEVEWLKERTGEWPVILLDEVMAELDLERRADLLKYVGKSEQVLFTTTDLNLFPREFSDSSEVWDVHDGTISLKK